MVDIVYRKIKSLTWLSQLRHGSHERNLFNARIHWGFGPILDTRIAKKCRANVDESVQLKVVTISNTPINIWVSFDFQKTWNGKRVTLHNIIALYFFSHYFSVSGKLEWFIIICESYNVFIPIEMSSCAIKLHLLI